MKVKLGLPVSAPPKKASPGSKPTQPPAPAAEGPAKKKTGWLKLLFKKQSSPGKENAKQEISEENKPVPITEPAEAPAAHVEAAETAPRIKSPAEQDDLAELMLQLEALEELPEAEAAGTEIKEPVAEPPPEEALMEIPDFADMLEEPTTLTEEQAQDVPVSSDSSDDDLSSLFLQFEDEDTEALLPETPRAEPPTEPVQDAVAFFEEPQLVLPETRPEVLEFSDDDIDLEKKLDEMIGDIVLDIEPVKTKKEELPKAADKNVVDLGGVEVSFEIEFDETIPEAVSAPDGRAAGSGTAFEIAPPAACGETGEQTNGRDKSAALAESIRRVRETGDAQKVIAELQALLAEVYGVPVAALSAFELEKEDLPEATSSAVSTGDKGSLAELSLELDAELSQLEAEGTTFLTQESTGQVLPRAANPVQHLLSETEEEDFTEELQALLEETSAFESEESPATAVNPDDTAEAPETKREKEVITEIEDAADELSRELDLLLASTEALEAEELPDESAEPDLQTEADAGAELAALVAESEALADNDVYLSLEPPAEATTADPVSQLSQELDLLLEGADFAAAGAEETAIAPGVDPVLPETEETPVLPSEAPAPDAEVFELVEAADTDWLSPPKGDLPKSTDELSNELDALLAEETDLLSDDYQGELQDPDTVPVQPEVQFDAGEVPDPLGKIEPELESIAEDAKEPHEEGKDSALFELPEFSSEDLELLIAQAEELNDEPQEAAVTGELSARAELAAAEEQPAVSDEPSPQEILLPPGLPVFDIGDFDAAVLDQLIAEAHELMLPEQQTGSSEETSEETESAPAGTHDSDPGHAAALEAPEAEAGGVNETGPTDAEEARPEEPGIEEPVAEEPVTDEEEFVLDVSDLTKWHDLTAADDEETIEPEPAPSPPPGFSLASSALSTMVVESTTPEAQTDEEPGEGEEVEFIELADLLTAFKEENEEQEGGKSEQEQPAPSENRPSKTLPASSEIKADLWDQAEQEITEESLAAAEFEINLNEVIGFEPNDSVGVLFDVVEEEMRSPAKAQHRKKDLPTSASRKIDNSRLQQAFQRYAVEARKSAEAGGAVEQQAAQISAEPAGVFRRLAASLADALIVTGASLLFGWFLSCPVWVKGSLFKGQVPQLYDILPPVLSMVWLFCLIWTVFHALSSLATGQTPGKRLFGIRVAGVAQLEVTFSQALVRALCYTALLWTLGLGLLPALWGRKRALHDRLSGTSVVLSDSGM